DRDLAADQISRQARQPIVLTLRPAIFDRDVAAFDIAGFGQALVERSQARSIGVGRQAAEIADHRHRSLLRACRERPRRRRTAEQRYELAAVHSNTSSARASNGSGTSIPTARAVFRLIASSYLVGACTGRSAVFSPLRMRST